MLYARRNANMKRTLYAACLALYALAGAAAQEKPRVELVFVLDSTGSMTDLIEGAKRKIWSIANRAASQGAERKLSVGLISYRDRGDDYVTKRYDLTDDIDQVFENLQSFSANGGGDSEESVNQALREAVRDMSWSKDPGAVKIVFLVGDYPPHMDYPQDVHYQSTCAEARKLGIAVNTIQCGEVPETTLAWRDIAKLGKGEFVALAQSGNMVAVETPYDAQISKISAEIGETLVTYGSEAEQSRSSGKLKKAAEAPAAVAADRAAYNLSTGGKSIQGKGDLIADAEEGVVSLSAIREDQLPPAMRSMKPAEREKYLEGLKAKRDKLNASLADLSKKRAAFIEAENKKAAAANKGDSFDLKVAEIIEKQAGKPKK
jgi:Mg-chelatase subunit ChlD